jgi:hypothetical protein
MECTKIAVKPKKNIQKQQELEAFVEVCLD